MKLVITEPLGISEAQAEALKKEYLPADLEMVYCNTPPKDDAEKAARAQGAELVMLANMPFKENVLKELKDVKLLSVAFTGVDHVGMDYCKEHGIVVSNCSGYANEAVSELAIGLTLALYRRMIASDKAVPSAPAPSASARARSPMHSAVKSSSTIAAKRRSRARNSWNSMNFWRFQMSSRCMCR